MTNKEYINIYINKAKTFKKAIIICCSISLILVVSLILLLYFQSFKKYNLIKEDYLAMYSIATAITLGSTVILVIDYLTGKKHTNSTIKKYKNLDFIYKEIDDKETMNYKDFKLFLTPNYIVSLELGLIIIKYSDVKWIYEEEENVEIKIMGQIVCKSLVVFTEKRKHYNFLASSSIEYKNEKFNEVYEKILEKVPNALVGKTKENKEKIKKWQVKR